MNTTRNIDGYNANQNKGWNSLGLTLATVTILSVVIFHALFDSSRVLYMTDNNLGYTAETRFGLPDSFISGAWTGGPLLGMQGTVPVCMVNYLQWILPLIGYVNWFHAIMMSLASIGFSLFCFRRGCRALPILFGVMAAFWVGSGLTLTYSGHNGKYSVLAFAGLGLWLIEMAASRKRIAWDMLAGGVVGMMFVEQQDVALFIGLFLGAYAIYAILRENAGNCRALIVPLILMVLTALLVGGPNVLSGYMTQVKGVVAMSDENPQKKWEYCTQWSLPPEDMLEFVAPGYRGIRSGDPEGPYWGRQGRSAEWEQSRQGFPNFKLESVYVGAIPIALAGIAILVALVNRRAGGWQNRKDPIGMQEAVMTGKGDDGAPNWPQRRGDVIFWMIATVMALLLSLGKFFPLYSIFYLIPGMSSIRNPMKFLHVFQIGLGILAAFGMDALLRGLPENVSRRTQRFAVVLLVTGCCLLLWTVTLAGARVKFENEFIGGGWAIYAPVMVSRMIRGALHAGGMTIIAGLGICLLVAWRKRQTVWRQGVLGALLIVMVCDVVVLSRDYIKVVNFEEIAGDNAVTVFLKENLKQQRVYMLSQEGFYNNWLMVLFPYHHIETFNISQMPRMPEDYDRWLKTVGRDPIRLWQLSAIGYVLGSDQTWQQIKKDSRFSGHFEAVKGYNLYASGSGVSVIGVSGDSPAQHRILRFKDGLPRFKLYNDWEVVPDAIVGNQLLDRNFDPHVKVLVSPDTAGPLPKSMSVSNGASKVITSQLSPTDARVTAEVASPAVLMFVNKHSSDWRVTVDGKPAPLLRCNSLCLGVYLESGRHDVRFYLQKQWGLFGVQMAGMLACLVAMIFLWRPTRNP